LKAGKDESARIKVEGVIREDFIIEAYEILELFCELLLARLGVINISKDCPPDIREAVCTIIYAAPRCDIKELSMIRQMLIIKFGKEFAADAVHNTDNCVNARIVHKLSIQTPENYLVFQYLNEIAKMYNLAWKAEFVPEPVRIEPIVMAQPLFPDPPKGGSNGGSPSVSFPSFPTPPGGSSYVPNFQGRNTGIPEPTFPSFPTPSVPTFNPQAMPGGSNIPNFPEFPSAPSRGSVSNFPEFPSPPVSKGNSSTFPDFPSPPVSKGSSSTFPDFPSPPISKGSSSFPEFPSPPSSGSSTINFPTPPGGSSNVPNFPSPPSSGDQSLSFPPPNSSGSSSVPDFDELTARFERLKNRKDG